AFRPRRAAVRARLRGPAAARRRAGFRRFRDLVAAAAREAVDVAVGVLVRRDGSFLLGSRPEGKPYAGYWEFPGGKLEPGESVNAALARELHEELGIRIGASHPWVTREFD